MKKQFNHCRSPAGSTFFGGRLIRVASVPLINCPLDSFHARAVVRVNVTSSDGILVPANVHIHILPIRKCTAASNCDRKSSAFALFLFSCNQYMYRRTLSDSYPSISLYSSYACVRYHPNYAHSSSVQCPSGQFTNRMSHCHSLAATRPPWKMTHTNIGFSRHTLTHASVVRALIEGVVCSICRDIRS